MASRPLLASISAEADVVSPHPHPLRGTCVPAEARSVVMLHRLLDRLILAHGSMCAVAEVYAARFGGTTDAARRRLQRLRYEEVPPSEDALDRLAVLADTHLVLVELEVAS